MEGRPTRHILSARTAQARQQEMEKWKRRSATIRFWRRALPVVIGLVVCVLAAWIAGRSLLIKATTPKPPEASGLRMMNPRFYGRDSANRAFVLGAQEASRDSSTGQNVALTKPDLVMNAGQPRPTTVQAESGLYHEDQRRLLLTGKVQLHSDGYVFTSPNALVDTAKGAVYGKSGVQGQGPLGHITASAYDVYDRGHRVIMKGDVHAHIVQ